MYGGNNIIGGEMKCQKQYVPSVVEYGMDGLWNILSIDFVNAGKNLFILYLLHKVNN